MKILFLTLVASEDSTEDYLFLILSSLFFWVPLKSYKMNFPLKNKESVMGNRGTRKRLVSELIKNDVQEGQKYIQFQHGRVLFFNKHISSIFQINANN